MREKTYEERSKFLGLWALEELGTDGVLEGFKMYRGYSSAALNELFVVDTNDKGTRGYSCKLKKARCTRDIVKFFFQIVINRWNDLDQSALNGFFSA